MDQETNTSITNEQLMETLQQAVSKHQTGRLQEAEELYRTILQSRPNHPEANHNMGVLAVQMQQPTAGLPYFMAALDADPECAQYWLSGIDALFRADQLDAAREVMAVALQQGLQGDEVDALVARMNAAAQVSGQADAEYPHALQESLSVSSILPQDSAKNPGSQEINTLVALFNEDRYAEASALARTLTERFPLHGFGWKALGAALKQMGRSADALEPMQKSATLSPNDADAHSNLSNTLKDLGRLTEAEVCCRRALQIKPDYAEAHNNLSIILHDLGRLDEAESSCRKALQIKPDYPEAHYSLSLALQNQGRLNEAESSCRRALEIKPDYPEAHNNLSVILQKLDRLAEAETCCRTALHIKQDYAEAHNNLGGILHEQGRLEEAETCCRKALETKPDYADAHYNLGSLLHELGRLDEAEASCRRALQIDPEYAEAHSNLGNTLHKLGRPDEAEASYRWALKIKPDFAEAHNNLGNILQQLGRLDEAESHYRYALRLKPDFAAAHSDLGNILYKQGRFDEAEASYRRTLEIKPDFVEVYCNLSITLKALNRLDEALSSYRQALEIKPDYAEAHYNLGIALNELGRLDQAESSFRRALEIKPDFVDVLDHLALLFNAQGKSMMALDTVKQSLQLNKTAQAKRIFVDCVKRLRPMQVDSDIRAAMVEALTEPWGRPTDLARIGIELVKLNPNIKGGVARATDAWPLRLSAQELFGTNDSSILADDPLLCALLGSTFICDIEMERFLTMARCVMLEAAVEITTSDDESDRSLSFYSMLARQCFINEYVFYHTAEEIQKASNLRDALVAALEAETQVPPLWLIAVAAYFPLCSLSLAPRLLDRHWPEQVAAVLVQQVREPEEELQIRATVPRLTDIDDEVSLLVQSQYEENPYPRWIKIEPAGKTNTIAEYLSQKFPLAAFKRHGTYESIDVLIAGCGTGQHSIGTAQQFQGAQVLAVDLSMSSLGYAKRKSLELGLTSVEYAQADLLRLGSLGRSFDVIESVGVLHHLADPLAGWRVLLSLLRPGGFMNLGFYSEVARRNIVRIRDFIAEQGYGSSASEIRQCRQDLMDLDKSADFGAVLKSPDVFSISTCRDLLFHVQEHRMTLTGIDAFLRNNNLAFLGFEIGGGELHAYKLRFPNDPAATNLDQWQIFEHENPDMFVGMYQFWIQKVS